MRSRRNYIICPQSGLEFTLLLSSVISYLPVSTPGQEELIYCEDIELKSVDVTWDPNKDENYKEEFTIAINKYGTRNGDRKETNYSRRISPVLMVI